MCILALGRMEIWRSRRDGRKEITVFITMAPDLTEPSTMLERHMTFDEAAKSDEFMTMQKSRLHRIKGDIWGQMQAVV